MQTKSTDFRIGNLVKVKGIITTISGIGSETELGQQYYQLDGFADPVIDTLVKVIRIDEKYLIKFGFKRDTHNTNFFDKKPFSLKWDNSELDFFLCDSSYNIHIKFIHQLQNLYFALTNEELQLK